MNEQVAEALETRTVAQLKEIAKGLGVKLNRSQRTLSTIREAIRESGASFGELAAALGIEIPAAKPAKKVGRPAAKRCESCGTRPASKESPEGRICKICLTEAEWKNEHDDFAHSDSEPVEGCWICHPELNRASEEYTPRTGTSRAGIIMNIRWNLSGSEKAQAVSKLIPGGKVSTSKTGDATYQVGDIEISWTARGQLISAVAAGRKMRNVSAILRLRVS